MRYVWTMPGGVVLVLLVLSQGALSAECWPFGGFHGNGNEGVRGASPEPSPLAKLNDQTKEFFAKTAETLGMNRPKAKASKQYLPWLKEPKDPRYLRSHKTELSWWDKLLGREEPERVDSLKDWVGLPKPGF